MTQAERASVQGLTISVAGSRTSKSWKPREYTWEELAARLAQTTRTGETAAEYRAMTKDQQGRAKDVGGFVGGVLAGGRRVKDAVSWRTLITLDADHVKGDLWALVRRHLAGTACVVYSTHSHTPESPRLRLVVPLADPVRAEEYEPLARMVSSLLGMEMFDDTTYEAHRLMYWPSTPTDGEFYFREQEGGPLDPEAVLAMYGKAGLDWRDHSHWPRSEREAQVRRREVEKAGDPTGKPGLIGAFCRAYTIEDAIERFIPDAYEKAGEDRWTFTGGSTSGGMRVYEDGLHAYSDHATDPASRRSCNAWDLVRLHKFGRLDDGAAEDTPLAKLPSQRAMEEMAAGLDGVRVELARARREEAQEDFADDGTPWETRLTYTKDGRLRQTIGNAVTILDNDPALAGAVILNDFSGKVEVVRDLPWRKAEKRSHWSDRDFDALWQYLEGAYGFDSVGKLQAALGAVVDKLSYHPVRDYLTGLQWDGVDRAETLLVDYLGAEDCPYVRTVTRKTLAAAVARVMTPGCKFDYMLTLVGAQGIGKSYIIKRLAGPWHSESVGNLAGKDALEQLRGKWMLEMAELSAMKRAEVESVKHFISTTVDSYRAPYARTPEDWPRQCIFIGTTNEAEFLRDATGNRRFWPVEVGKSEPVLDLFTDMTDHVVGQVWAEAVQLWKAGEKLYLQGDEAQEAARRQEAHQETDTRVGEIMEFLDMPLPENWDGLDTEARRRFINGSEFGRAEGTTKRTRVCAAEVLVELFGYDRGKYDKYKAKEINAILRGLPGWSEFGRAMRFGTYGVQRGFVRGM